MSKVDDGGPAFPEHVAISPSGDIYGSNYFSAGMSVRDWFAGQALAGWLAGLPVDAAVRAPNVASFAYEIADAMLAARKEGQGGGA